MAAISFTSLDSGQIQYDYSGKVQNLAPELLSVNANGLNRQGINDHVLLAYDNNLLNKIYLTDSVLVDGVSPTHTLQGIADAIEDMMAGLAGGGNGSGTGFVNGVFDSPTPIKMLVDGQEVFNSEGAERYKDVQLSNADILDLLNTPFEVLPAPGVGKAYGFIRFSPTQLYRDFSGGAYSHPDTEDYASIDYTFGTDGSAVDRVLENNVGWDQATASLNVNNSALQGDSTNQFSVGNVGNVGLYIKNTGTVNFTGGDSANTLSIRVWYVVLPESPFGA